MVELFASWLEVFLGWGLAFGEDCVCVLIAMLLLDYLRPVFFLSYMVFCS